MKKIISLTNLFIKEYYQNLPIFDTSKMKFNKKSVFFWLLALIFFGVSYVSYEVLDFLVNVGQKELFLHIYIPILTILLAFQSILSCANIFFFSKETEHVLHMPIKPVELLLSKLNTLLCMLYFSEGIVAVVPFILYGMKSGSSLFYYPWIAIIVLILPIFVATFVSIINFLLMRFSKLVRNKDVFQILLTVFLILSVFIVESFIMKYFFSIHSDQQALSKMQDMQSRMEGINTFLLIINPIIAIQSHPTSLTAFISFAKIILICSIELISLILIGKYTYLKYILINIASKGKNLAVKGEVKFNKKTRNKSIAYITKEIKILIKNSIFFMQCVFPVIILLVSCIILLLKMHPVFIEAMQNDSIKTEIENLKFNMEFACYILIALQVLFSISNISLTAISREGKDALFMKYIPIELYKQFIYKNIPQFVLNLLVSIVVLGMIWWIVPTIEIINIILIFLISIIINIINCYLMLIVDLLRPNLDWETEIAVVRKSDNKLFQYAFMIINVLLLLYIGAIFKNTSLIIALISELEIYSIIFIIIDRCVKKWQNKLFKKII